MKTTIDADGRLVIPEEVRRQAGIRPGTVLDVRWRDGRIEIEPTTATTTTVRLVRKGRLLVAVPEAGREALTTEMVEETRKELAQERGSGV